MDQTNRDLVRLRLGEGHRGWLLDQIKGRTVVLRKDSRFVSLSMPLPGKNLQPDNL
ncbi:MAG: hypothetical protein JO366_01510 [Methylobacteriaceae bacterium]|nr:hypothetical protein [Methylobacteriaceae bacterium]